MNKNLDWFRWYTPQVRLVCHIVFWLLVTLLYYGNYSRMGGNYVWIFIFKELVVTISLFYSASWIISKWIWKRPIYPLFVYVAFAYLLWATSTYLVCHLAREIIPESDLRFDRYLNFVLNDGLLGLFTFPKFSVLALDFIFAVSIPLAPKLTKLLMEGRLKMVKMERDSFEVEVNFLKSQISPHFLFNTLNNIYWMLEKNDPETPATVLKLSGLVRYVLYESKKDQILLSKEVGFINDYLDLARLRYGDNTLLKTDIAEIDEPYNVVPLILIPFIENAFKHGPDRSRTDSWVHISLQVKNDMLFLAVKNGVNRSSVEPPVGGIGLENTKRRLELFYPGKHELKISENENSYEIDMIIELNTK